VKLEYTVTQTFSAAHRSDGRLCGHNYTVSVTQVEENRDIVHALASIIAELDERQLEDMMPAATTTPAGIAAWFVERLALRFPRLVRVTVAPNEKERVSVMRDPTR
jgi:6-pyruvoyl-tetrahydropterin synthase